MVSDREHPLAAYQGARVLSAGLALLKGILETEIEIGLIAGSSRHAFREVFRIARDHTVSEILQRHGITLVQAPAMRAVTLCNLEAVSGRSAITLIDNAELDLCVTSLEHLRAAPLPAGTSMGLIIEDNPETSPLICPRKIARALRIPCIEPADLLGLRDSISHALRVSRAGRTPAAVVVHRLLMKSASTMTLHPNRISDGTLTAGLRRPPVRKGEPQQDVLRLARRLELNTARAMPSPGERIQIGFVVVGPADRALTHLATVLHLQGQVPILHIGLLNPFDESIVERFLTRCQNLIVLEPRPGTIEAQILECAETMRRRGEAPALVWGQRLPPDANGESGQISSDLDLHPSVLARRIRHLLHQVRPREQIDAQLAAPPPPLLFEPPARMRLSGDQAQRTVLRRMLEAVNRWLSEREAEDDDKPQRILAIDGVAPQHSAVMPVMVEIFSHSDFAKAGHGAIEQAAASQRPWILLLLEAALDPEQDLVRLARGMVPADEAARTTVVGVDLSDRAALRDAMRTAALTDSLTVIVVRDVEQRLFDADAQARALREIDRLGFQPTYRIIRPAEEACEIRARPDNEEDLVADHEAPAMRTELTIDELTRRIGRTFRFRIRPLLEEFEIVRSRPPVHAAASGESSQKPAIPAPVHAASERWRAHLAGFRGNEPGVAARVLAEAGQRMGYSVHLSYDTSAIGAGRRAWSQILYTRQKDAAAHPSLTATIPFGEADLLLGLDCMETLRAIGPQHGLRVASKSTTNAVVNTGYFTDDATIPDPGDLRAIAESIRAICREGDTLHEDVAGASRAWFYTDRVADIILLGMAYQRGYVPVTLDAIEAALQSTERSGYGRCVEAFQFGRRLALDSARPRVPAPHEEGLEHLVRRLTLLIGRTRIFGQARARRFRRLLQTCLTTMPGLSETDRGRQARRDFVLAAYRCFMWGGFDYAERFGNIVTALYLEDRGDTGRSVTRDAILPLAEAMLIRDPIYVSTVASSRERMQQIRQKLNVKPARGDEISRRILTRLELIIWRRRIRLDLYSTGWPSRLLSLLGLVIPTRYRGVERDRKARELVVDFVNDAAHDLESNYGELARRMARLHELAITNRLRFMPIDELAAELTATE